MRGCSTTPAGPSLPIYWRTESAINLMYRPRLGLPCQLQENQSIPVIVEKVSPISERLTPTIVLIKVSDIRAGNLNDLP